MIVVTKLRLLIASIAGAAAFFVVPAIGVIVGWSQMPFLNADGTPDDAPVRGGAAFVLLSPFLFVLLAAFAFSGALLLQHFGQLKPKSLWTFVIVASICAGLLMAYNSPFGWQDAVMSFGLFAGLVFVASGLSAWVWLKVAMRPNNTVERDGPQAARTSL